MNAVPITLMLVDDHAIVRSGFRRLLEQEPQLQIVAEADNGERAYALYVRETPDVVVIDLSMPGMSGFETIRRIVAREPTARILVFSMHEDAMRAERAIQLGARGYVTKSSAPDVLARAIVEVAAGRLFLSADVAQAIAQSKIAGEDNPLKQLSAREFEIFRLLVAGHGATDIADILNLSAKTVANNRTLINQKLRTSGDVELVLLALRHNLV
ncbi:MAG TPA: response regulator transcription factor [Steroidobacteraceae bacterium]|jgi:two-component system invasion response regulator UvrY|nr:response regulator transcription factor [Steroidobacteraceae bacterium]